MTHHIITKDVIQSMLDHSPAEKVAHIVGRALVVLFRNQTVTERDANTTQINNNVGFTSGDALSGTITAKTYIKNKSLAPWQVDRWTRKNARGYSRLSKYWAQLDVAAKAKRQRTAAA